jgi:4-hydroxy-3-methylbut-2-enyl diphosphate reductase
VERAHDAAQSLQQAGCHVLVIGKPGHVEVRGIVEDLHSFDIIEDIDDVRRFPHARLGIVCQTTTQEAEARRIIAAIHAHNPQAEIRHLDTICHPTKEHQRSLERLLSEVQAVVVVGGRNSNNTRELARRCRERGVAAHHVQDASDLRPEWFRGLNVVGLTAGTSTLDDSIQEVERWLLALEEGTVQPTARVSGPTG